MALGRAVYHDLFSEEVLQSLQHEPSYREAMRVDPLEQTAAGMRWLQARLRALNSVPGAAKVPTYTYVLAGGANEVDGHVQQVFAEVDEWELFHSDDTLGVYDGRRGEALLAAFPRQVQQDVKAVLIKEHGLNWTVQLVKDELLRYLARTRASPDPFNWLVTWTDLAAALAAHTASTSGALRSSRAEATAALAEQSAHVFNVAPIKYGAPPCDDGFDGSDLGPAAAGAAEGADEVHGDDREVARAYDLADFDFYMQSVTDANAFQAQRAAHSQPLPLPRGAGQFGGHMRPPAQSGYAPSGRAGDGYHVRGGQGELPHPPPRSSAAPQSSAPPPPAPPQRRDDLADAISDARRRGVCFNCGSNDHFVRACTEQRQVHADGRTRWS